MNPRTNYEMTQEDLDKIMKACKPTPCMMIGGSVGASPQENANNAWAALGKEMGFDSMTVRPSSKGARFFTAVPSETGVQKERRKERLRMEQEGAKIVSLEKEIEERQIQLYKIVGDVLLSMDGDQWCATEKDFVSLQESPAGFGDTMAKAVLDLRGK
jgi:hypothetical protein